MVQARVLLLPLTGGSSPAPFRPHVLERDRASCSFRHIGLPGRVCLEPRHPDGPGRRHAPVFTGHVPQQAPVPAHRRVNPAALRRRHRMFDSADFVGYNVLEIKSVHPIIESSLVNASNSASICFLQIARSGSYRARRHWSCMSLIWHLRRLSSASTCTGVGCRK